MHRVNERRLILLKKWKTRGVPPIQKQGALLQTGIRLLQESLPGLRKNRTSLPEQPFDLHLLNWSPLYERSRRVYLHGGGSFTPTLVSSPRSLSSSILLENRIEYSPIERELIWSATDQFESKHLQRLLDLRTYCSSLFHEQNHRILWNLLPSAPRGKAPLQRFLNFAESLVITLDMALADQLGPYLGSLFYLTGVTYDPGSTVRKELPKARDYRNYLQATMHATYLNLELYQPSQIPIAIKALLPNLGPFAERAAMRSGNLDRSFIQSTNLRWQTRNYKVILESLSKKDGQALILSSDPMDHREQYLIAEQCFNLIGL